MVPARWAAFRALVWRSPRTRVGSLEIVDLLADQSSGARLEKIRQSIRLIQAVQPWRHASSIRPLRWILIVAGGGEAYSPELNACILDVPFVEGRSLRVVSAMIIHEGTHARLWRLGFRYDPHQRNRIERLATEAQADFLSRTKDGAALAAEALASLNSPWWGDMALFKRRSGLLRAHGFPRWLARVWQRLFG